jgi:hypothetical protein
MKGGNNRTNDHIHQDDDDGSNARIDHPSSSSRQEVIAQANNSSADGAPALSGINRMHRRRYEETPNETTLQPSSSSSLGHIHNRRTVTKQNAQPNHTGIKDDEEQQEKHQTTETAIQLGLIRIDDHDEEQPNQDDSHRPARANKEVALPQKNHPGAFSVRGPEYISSDQSTTGTIVVGDEHHQNDERISPTGPLFHEGSQANQDLAVAAEVAPTEEIIQRRVQEQVQIVLQQTARAEVVPHETHQQHNKDDTSVVPTEESKIARIFKSKKSRFVTAIVVVMAVVIGITVPRVSKSNDAAEEGTTQRLALMSLYESTNGTNWDLSAQMNWGSLNVNECEWEGVTCTNGKVTDLDKFDNNLKGTIPADIGLLTELVHLDLGNNTLSGPLPSTLGSLSKLTGLKLWTNELTGTIPTEFGKLTNTVLIGLDSNLLTGTIPTELGRLTNIVDLWLYGNTFTGAFPSGVASMTKLTTLYLGLNELIGTIPTELGRLTNMVQLGLQINKFTGTLPSEIASMTKLGYLSAYNNFDLDVATEICMLDLPTFQGDCPPCECCTVCFLNPFY